MATLKHKQSRRNSAKRDAHRKLTKASRQTASNNTPHPAVVAQRSPRRPV